MTVAAQPAHEAVTALHRLNVVGVSHFRSWILPSLHLKPTTRLANKQQATSVAQIWRMQLIRNFTAQSRNNMWSYDVNRLFWFTLSPVIISNKAALQLLVNDTKASLSSLKTTQKIQCLPGRCWTNFPNCSSLGPKLFIFFFLVKCFWNYKVTNVIQYFFAYFNLSPSPSWQKIKFSQVLVASEGTHLTGWHPLKHPAFDLGHSYRTISNHPAEAVSSGRLLSLRAKLF